MGSEMYIRDELESAQAEFGDAETAFNEAGVVRDTAEADLNQAEAAYQTAVPYTHLTLATNQYV